MKKINKIVLILMERDRITLGEAIDALTEAREMVDEGMDPEEVLYDQFGLEPDYLFDLI